MPTSSTKANVVHVLNLLATWEAGSPDRARRSTQECARADRGALKTEVQCLMSNEMEIAMATRMDRLTHSTRNLLEIAERIVAD
ncbi:hypothetical protein JKG47_11855 [Acidithiobacillus sp. MC6.1]|nr:hypothetical protein [Acidithiobacillus sp. MC6.1]